MVSEKSEKAEAFRQEVPAWLDENLPKAWGTPEYVPPEPFSQEQQDLGKSFQTELYKAGYTGFGVPQGETRGRNTCLRSTCCR